jgi:hypothetical protein
MALLTASRIGELSRSRPITTDPEILRKIRTAKKRGGKTDPKQDAENAEISRISKLCEACVEEADNPEWDTKHPDFSPREDCEFLKCSTCARRRAIREGTAVCGLGKFSLSEAKNDNN